MRQAEIDSCEIYRPPRRLQSFRNCFTSNASGITRVIHTHDSEYCRTCTEWQAKYRFLYRVHTKGGPEHRDSGASRNSKGNRFKHHAGRLVRCWGIWNKPNPTVPGGPGTLPSLGKAHSVSQRRRRCFVGMIRYLFPPKRRLCLVVQCLARYLAPSEKSQTRM